MNIEISKELAELILKSKVLVLGHTESGRYFLESSTLSEAVVEDADDQGYSAVTSRTLFLKLDLN